MSFKYAYIIPLVCGIWFYLTFIITYIVAVYRKDVTPAFPYISDTGTWSPESCIFSLMLNIGALMQASIVYIRYRHIKHLISKESSLTTIIGKRNYISMYLGLMGAFGVMIVADFQETNAFYMHVFGALLAFGLGSVYLTIQTLISFQVYPVIGNKTVNYIRLVCCVTSSVMFLLTFGLGGFSLLKFTGDDPTKWKKEDGAYVIHFISAITEWIMAFCTILYLVLYSQEFKKCEFTEPLLIESA